MSIFESLLYGFVSGLAEFLPVSAKGHQSILMRIFGMDHRNPLCDLIVHIAILIALVISCHGLLMRLRREMLISSRRGHKRAYDYEGIYEIRLIKAASFVFAFGALVYFRTIRFESDPLILSLFFTINGILIIVPEYVRRGNKTAKNMTGFDGILLGLASALSAIPGISRVASGMGLLSLRGADIHKYQNWVLLLSIPALIVSIIFDFVHIFTIGLGAVTFISVIGCFLAGIAAFTGGYIGITFLRFLSEKNRFAGFAYYSWGAAMISLVLYLIA